MNGAAFKDWMHTYLLPAMPSNGVLVIDRATYHLELTDYSKGATSSMNKAHLINYLIEHKTNINIADLNIMNKSRLLIMCKNMRPPKRLKIEDWILAWNLTHRTNVRFLILPVATPQLNPIELVWGNVKTWVASNNHEYKMENVRSLVNDRVQWIKDNNWWEKAYQKAHRFCIEQHEVDNIYDADFEDARDHELFAENDENPIDDSEYGSDTLEFLSCDEGDF